MTLNTRLVWRRGPFVRLGAPEDKPVSAVNSVTAGEDAPRSTGVGMFEHGRMTPSKFLAKFELFSRVAAVDSGRQRALPRASALDVEGNHGPLVSCHDRGSGHEVCGNRRIARSDSLLVLASLPALELPEELVLLLLGRQRPAGGLLALIDEARKDRFEILRHGCGSYWRIALEPLLGRRETPPPGEFGGNIDLAPFRMVAAIQQRLKSGEERLDEIHQIAIALGSDVEIGSDKHRTHRDRVDRLVRRHEHRIIGSS
jgi:hypothetical protein